MCKFESRITGMTIKNTNWLLSLVAVRVQATVCCLFDYPRAWWSNTSISNVKINFGLFLGGFGSVVRLPSASVQETEDLQIWTKQIEQFVQLQVTIDFLLRQTERSPGVMCVHQLIQIVHVWLADFPPLVHQSVLDHWTTLKHMKPYIKRDCTTTTHGERYKTNIETH